MALEIPPFTVDIEAWNREVQQLGLGRTDAPGLNERRLRKESGKYYLEVWSGSEWKKINEITAEEVQQLLLTVHGPGSGLDADKLDGQEGDFYAQKLYTPTDGNTPLSDYPDGVTTNLVSNGDPGWPLGSGIAITIKVGLYRCCQLFFNSNGMLRYTRGYRYDTGWYSWQKVWTQDTDGSGSGMDADLYRGKKIQYGQVTNAKDTGVYVFFAEAFQTTPVITVSCREELVAWITDITTTSCRIRVSSTTNKTVYWHAIG